MAGPFSGSLGTTASTGTGGGGGVSLGTTAGTAADAGAVSAALQSLQGQIGTFAPARTVTSGSSVAILPTDGTVRIRKTTGSPTAVVLEASPVLGVTHTIKDGLGDAATNPIAVTASNGGTIDGQASFVLSRNSQSLTVQWAGDDWMVI